jgi:hypothetical protein
MKDKGHFWLSIIKSLIRIGFCLWAWKIHMFEIALWGLIFAECIGILEEVVDRR